MVTYNHEKYIEESIRSAANQKTDFYFEIIVADDFSTDNTRKIIKKLAKEHPDFIRPIYQKTNLGPQKNFQYALSQCRGQYLAILEGDDYWVCNSKLQKQVDFLESNSEISGCFSRARVVSEEDPSSETIFPSQLFEKNQFNLADILTGFFIPTLTVMYRTENIKNRLPNWHLDFPNGDWLIHIMNAQVGDIVLIDEVMGVYRIHSGGIWSMADRIDILIKSIRSAKKINEYLNFKFGKIIRNNVSNWRYEMAYLAADQKSYSFAYRCAVMGLIEMPASLKKFLKALIATTERAIRKTINIDP